MSLFNYKRIAGGYANDRPSYHCMIMERIREELQLCKNFDYGLDVGCGSGSSTMALKEICDEVIGIEESIEMLRAAKNKFKGEDICFLKCKAEESPFRDDLFDIVTASGCINWIDPRMFLPLMSKQIKMNGWLIIYDDSFSGRMTDSERFVEWYNDEYLVMFPKPSRNEEKWDDALVRPYHFSTVKQEMYSHTVAMNQKEFINFIITQSNVISAVEQGEKSLESVKDWFDKTLEAIFSGGSRELIFEGYIWYIKNKGVVLTP